MYCDDCANKGRTFKYFLLSCIKCNSNQAMHDKEKICRKCSENKLMCQKCGINVITGDKLERKRNGIFSKISGDKEPKENWKLGTKSIFNRTSK